MPTEKITIPDIDALRFARLQANLATHGLKLTGNDGEAKDFGADVTWNYSASAQTLTLIVKHGPHLKNFDDFCSQLKSWVEAVS
jgi:hypothetical protein